MKTSMRVFLKTMMIAALFMLAKQAGAGNIRFVAVVYDLLTYDPVSGETVNFLIQNPVSAQVVLSQSFTSNNNGEVITPLIHLNDSAFYQYSFSLLDCNNDTIEFHDSLQGNQNDTIFLFLGICHITGPYACMAKFTFSADSLNPLKIHFTNISTGNPTSWFWTFGDGTTSNLQDPVKEYTAPGMYLACLTVSDTSYNYHHTWCNWVDLTASIVINTAFSSQVDSFSVMPRMVVFHNQTFSNVPMPGYLWDFGDGTTSDVSDPVHQYQYSGQYQVCLKSGFAGNYYDSICQGIVIPPYYNVWGQVFSGSTTVNGGKVQLFNPQHASYPLLDEIPIGSFGLYYFAQRIEHRYALRVLPDRTDPAMGDYLPTYSGNALFWKEADNILLNGDISNYDIYLVKKKVLPAGTCSIDGTVQYAAGQFADDALVILLSDPDNVPVAFDYTDSAGSFSLGQLPYGTYWLLAEVPGMECNAIQIVLSQQNPVYSGQSLWLTMAFATGEIQGEKGIILWPNPASERITIDLPQPGEKYYRLIMADLKGQVILLQDLQSYAVDEITLDIGSLASGTYIVSLVTENGILRRKFIKMD